jgi:predicted nucleic acid-binding protein
MMKAAAAKRFVLDAPVAVAWCFGDEATKFTESVLDRLSNGAEALVPAIWLVEVANALLIAERRKRISLAQVTSLLQKIAGLPIAVMAIDSARAFDHILPVARQQTLSGYDGAYLELALRQGLPLATLDEQLRRAAKSTGVVLMSNA